MEEIKKPSLRQVVDKGDNSNMGDNTLGGALGGGNKNDSSNGGGSSSSGGGGASSSSSSSTQSNATGTPTEKEFRGNSLDAMLAMFGSNDNGSSYIDSSGTIYYKKKKPSQTNQMYSDAPVIVTDPVNVSHVMDKMGPAPKERFIKPLEYHHSIYDKKRSRSITENRQDLITEYNLRIGDSVFVIPPEYIQVNNTSHTRVQTALRQPSSFKTKTGHTNREILITLYFNGSEQINGHSIDSPFKFNYHMDGLLSLIAQFKCTPFLPVQNEYLNLNFNIFSVALQSMSIATVSGFPGCLSVTLVMQEFYSTPYTTMHNMVFDETIDWDLFRYYYQRYIDRNLKTISEGNLNGKFKFSVLDKDKLIQNPKIDLKDDKYYYDILDSVENVQLVDMSFTMNNILANLQMQEHPTPTVQFLGGSDIYFNMTFETTDSSIVAMFNDVADITQTMTRELTDFQGIGFIKIKNEITKLLGINNFMLNSLQVNTVPEFPGLNVINIECISYELGTSKDVLTGMRPFEGDKLGGEDDLISKKVFGAFNKIKQDNIIEKKMMKLELFPDLQLPTYDELDVAIDLINKYKSKKGMAKLPYDKYPRPNTYVPGKGDRGTYNGYADPDFYFFYYTKWTDTEYSKFTKATSEGGKLDTNKDGNVDFSVEGKSKSDKENNSSRVENRNISILTNAIEESIKEKLKGIPFAQCITPVTTIARQYAVGEDEEEYQKAWRAGNYKFERNFGTGGTGVGGASGNLNVEGMGNLQNVTGNALCDLAISRKDISWYVWGAEGQQLTTSLLNSLSKSHGGGHYSPTVWSKADKGMYGYDCAGLIRWCLKQLGVKDKSYTCTSGPMYSTVDQKISKDQLQPGDLLWHSGHVALYAGNGNTIEAMNSSKGVCIGNVGNRFTGFGRWNNVPSTQEVLAKMGNNGSSSSTTESTENTQSSSSATSSTNNSNSTTNIKPNTPGRPNTRNRLRNEYITVERLQKDIQPRVPAVPEGTASGSSNKKPSNKKPSSNTSSNNTSSNTTASNTGQGFSNGVPNLSHPDANVDWGHGIQASTLDAYFKNKLAGSGAYWVGYGNIYKINPGLCAAISVFETGNGSSSQINNHNNPGGLRSGGDAGHYVGKNGKFAKFSCLQEGIRTKVSLLSRNYIAEGRRTPEQIGAKYAPTSDPYDNGGNAAWPANVRKFYKLITGEEFDPSKAGTGVKNEMLEPATGGWNGGGVTGGVNAGGGGWSGPLIGNYVPPPTAPQRTPNKDAGTVYGRGIDPLYGSKKDLEAMIGKVTIDEIEKYDFEKEKAEKDKNKDKDNQNNQNSKKPRTPSAPEDTDLNKKPQDKDKPVHKVKELNSFARPIFMYSPLNYAVGDAIAKEIFDEKYGGNIQNSAITGIHVEITKEIWKKVYEALKGNSSNKDKDKKQARANANDPGGASTSDDTGINSKFESAVMNRGAKQYYEACSYGDTSGLTTSLMCVDMEAYSHTGRMSRAFPTFLFMVLDDGGDWVDAKKLWSNFYSYKPVVDIRLHQDYSNPVHTATVTLSNVYDSLDQKASPYEKINSLADEKGFVAWMYKKTGLMLCAPKVDQKAIDLKNNIYDSINIKEGARLHLRMGYGSNPMMLPICFNGVVAEVENRVDSTFIVAQSDGAELINDVVSTKQDQCNNMIRYGSEPSNVIGSILVERDEKWLNLLSSEWGELSKFGIEHFGIHLGYNTDDASSKEYDLLKNIYLGLYKMTRLTEGEWIAAFKTKVKNNFQTNIQNSIDNNETFFEANNIHQNNNSQGNSNNNNSNNNNNGSNNNNNNGNNNRTPRVPPPEIDPNTPPGTPPSNNNNNNSDNNNENNENTENNQNQQGQGESTETDEDNINVFLFNKTPWECFKMFENGVPEFICQPGYHQFESRLFFGMPHYLFSYRYDVAIDSNMQKIGEGHGVYEAAKTYSQFHYIDGLDNIIDNSIKASSKDLYTNCVVTYSLGGEFDSTPTIYSDRSIINEKQKTKIIDSSINQDYSGPDGLYQLTGITVGKNAAINTGVSCLIDSWKNSYKGTITIIGDASIKPCDYIYVNDNASKIYGNCTVREVIHEFSMSTGFTSVITPGLIATTTLKNSGFNNVARSMITLGSSFAANYYIRNVGVKTMQNFATSLCVSKTAKNLINSKALLSKVDLSFLKSVAKHYDEVLGLVKTGKAIDKVKDISVGAKNMYNTVKNVKYVKSIKNSITSLKVAITASGSAVPVIGNIVGYIVSSLLLDWLLNAIIEEFMYDNSVNVYPLMMKDKPLIAGAKGQTALIPGLGESNVDLNNAPKDDDEE